MNRTVLFAVFCLFSVSTFATHHHNPTASPFRHLGIAAWETTKFVAKRIPNWRELAFDVGFEALVTTFFEEHLNVLGKNPAARAPIRNAAKLIPTILKAKSQIPVGSTAYRYDGSQVASIGSKVAINAGMIYIGTQMGFNASTASLSSNFVSDTAARCIVKVGQRRQAVSSPLTWHQFGKSNKLWASTFTGAAVEVVPKLAFMSVLGEGVKYIDLGTKLHDAVIYVADGTGIRYWVPTPAQFVAHAVSITGVTIVMATSARVIMDGVAVAMTGMR